MNETKTCPLCGKDIRGDETFCEDCQQMAHHEQPTFSENEEEVDAQDSAVLVDEIVNAEDVEKEVPIEKKSRKKTYFFLFIGIVILLSAGAFGAFKYKEMEEAREVETALWSLFSEENTPVSYSGYLSQYPEGQYSKEANNRIVFLKEMEEKAWEIVAASDKTAVFSSFIENNPDSPYLEQALARLDSLAWLSARKTATKEAYKAYIDNVTAEKYAGNYLTAAQKELTELEELDKIKTIDAKELTRVTARVTELAKLLSTYQYTKARALMASKIDYMGQKSKTPMFVTEDLRATINKDKIKAVTYTPDTKAVSVTRDNNNVYSLEVAVTKRIVYKARNKKTETLKMTLHIELDKDLKLQAVRKK